MNTVKGDWYAHVTVSPYGFECAMALTDACTEIDVVPDCNAQVTKVQGIPSVNPDKDNNDSTYSVDGHYFGPDGMLHTMNWAITDLWNCNKCATFSVQDITGNSQANSTMDFATLAKFVDDENVSTTLTSYTSYYNFEYKLSLSDCDTDPT